ncbi:MAG: signal peptidase I [Vallitalea sp.]|jgi:signal peptidase I|nr:signal peptidase I [Vallitalea sp.]
MKKKIFNEVKDTVKFVVIVVVSVLILQSHVVASTKVQQHSMEHTLHENDFLFAQKISYQLSSPKFGDVIIFLEERPKGFWGRSIGVCIEDIAQKFSNNQPRMRFVKRVIGVSGDTIDINNGKVFVNGKQLEESYIVGDTDARNLEYPLVVPEGKLFVLGDNRTYSLDSRNFGCIDINNVEGKVLIRVWPFNKIKIIK